MKYFFFIFLFFSFVHLPLQAAGEASAVLGQTAKESAVGAVDSKLKEGIIDNIIPPQTREWIGKQLASPVGIMIVSTIGGVNAGVLYSAAKDQENESANNIKKIEKIMASYKDSWINFCPNGRDKLEEPNCYCYLDSGKKNSNRTNSNICVNLWKKNDNLLSSANENYNALQFSDPSGCVNVSGAFDENCQCKKLIASNGQNACMKTIGLSTAKNQLGAAYLKASGFGNVMTNLASTMSGNTNLDNLNERSLALAIAKQGELNNGLYEKLYSGANKKNFPEFINNEQVLKYQNAVFRKQDMQALSKALGNTSAITGSNTGLNSSQANLIKNTLKKVGLDLEGSGKGLNTKDNEKKSGLELNFSDSSSNTAIVEIPPEKTYKFKDADITKNESASLFEIISNRYIQSGLRRLFEEEPAAN